jgi:hypothetical protein
MPGEKPGGGNQSTKYFIISVSRILSYFCDFILNPVIDARPR